MEKIQRLIIGGGASGLMLAAYCKENTLLLERGARVGKKLSATGNGQGNVTNEEIDERRYFSFTDCGKERVSSILRAFGKEDLLAFLEDLGGLFLADEKGRVYPTGKQASAVTDLFRKRLQERGCDVRVEHRVTKIEKGKDGFLVTADTPQGEKVFLAENIALCTGGKAAKNFGTDGNGFLLAEGLSHTVTKLYPSLVQLKTTAKDCKILKGIRIPSANIRAYCGKEKIAERVGDVIFTDYGVSGDGVFRISSFVSNRAEEGNITLLIDLLPEISDEKLQSVLERKIKKAGLHEDLLCGILNNQAGRVVMKRFFGKTAREIVNAIRNFTLTLSGTLGFDYAQVTKGGVSMNEVDENLQSKRHKGLYFAGEILDTDGECGGYNLQWAFSSAVAIARAWEKK